MKTDTAVIVIEHDDKKSDLDEALNFSQESLDRIENSLSKYETLSEGLIKTVLGNKITGSELLYLASVGIKKIEYDAQSLEAKVVIVTPKQLLSILENMPDNMFERVIKTLSASRKSKTIGILNT